MLQTPAYVRCMFKLQQLKGGNGYDVDGNNHTGCIVATRLHRGCWRWLDSPTPSSGRNSARLQTYCRSGTSGPVSIFQLFSS